MFTEREAIREVIQSLLQEKRQMFPRMEEINKMLPPLLEQLKVLDAKDAKELGILFDPQEMIREMKTQQHEIRELKEELRVTRDSIPSVPPQIIAEVLLRNEQTAAKYKEIIEEEEIVTTTKRKRTEKHEENSTQIREEKVRVNQDIKKQAPLVGSILKERGVPMQLQALVAILQEDHDISWRNPTSTLKYIMEYEPHIERANKGFYQWNTSKR